MTTISTIQDFPRVTFLPEEAKEKMLPPLEGREVITRQCQIRVGKDEIRQGYMQTYSYTNAELTQLLNSLQLESTEYRTSNKVLLGLPDKIETFMELIREQLNEYRQEQTAVLEQVYQILDELQEGKIKPSGDMMSLILDAINGQKERMDKLETAFFRLRQNMSK